MTTPTAYPLAWPPGWPRTKERQIGTYRSSLAVALTNLRAEISRLCGPAAAKTLILSSNAALGHSQPDDPGVVAYVTWEGQQIAIPCDRWKKLEHNVQAIALTIEAMRAMERHGAKHMIKAMFQGFVALPSRGDDWRTLLGDPKTWAEADAAYKQRARHVHPDAGGSVEAMKALNLARVAARVALPG